MRVLAPPAFQEIAVTPMAGCGAIRRIHWVLKRNQHERVSAVPEARQSVRGVRDRSQSVGQPLDSGLMGKSAGATSNLLSADQWHHRAAAIPWWSPRPTNPPAANGLQFDCPE